MKSQDEIIEVLCNEVGGAVYAGEYDASLIGREFVHFKGGHYRLLGFARFSESEELMVVYQTQSGIRDWILCVPTQNQNEFRFAN